MRDGGDFGDAGGDGSVDAAEGGDFGGAGVGLIGGEERGR